jgi:CD2 antigen cytoplasmic tail-binding protein 2
VLTEILSFLQPSETIARALRRLGGKKGTSQSASQRWKAKKQKTQAVDEQSVEDKEKFLRLTELADKVLSRGNMEVYEMTHEKVNYLLKKFEPAKTEIPEDMDNDDALDMFAENFDKDTDTSAKDGSKEKDKEAAKSETAESAASKSGVFNLSLRIIYSWNCISILSVH